MINLNITNIDKCLNKMHSTIKDFKYDKMYVNLNYSFYNGLGCYIFYKALRTIIVKYYYQF